MELPLAAERMRRWQWRPGRERIAKGREQTSNAQHRMSNFERGDRAAQYLATTEKVFRWEWPPGRERIAKESELSVRS